MSRRFTLGATILVFAVVMASSEIVLHFHAAEVASQQRAASLGFASELRARADRELNSVLYLASGIVGYLMVRHDHLDPDEINRILAAVHAFGRHIRNFSIAVGYRMSYVYPITGNESVLDRDYREIPDQWPAVRTAIDSGKGVLTGPVQLVQGGSALIYRIPIRVEGKHWGLLSTVIDMPSFEDAAFRGLDNERIEFAIRGEEPNGASGGVFIGREELFADPLAVRLTADVPNGTWAYAVRVKNQGVAAKNWGFRMLGWALALLAGFGVHTVLRQRGELARYAGFDCLTDLPNRRLFDDRLEQAIRRNARNDAGQIAALFLDLDGFKKINDLYGHKFGDAVLRKVAMRLRNEMRLGDTVARWAGDEFAIIIEEASVQQVEQLTERLRQSIVLPFEIEGTVLEVATSIGAAFFPREAASAVELLELADKRMFEDKQRRQGT